MATRPPHGKRQLHRRAIPRPRCGLAHTATQVRARKPGPTVPGCAVVAAVFGPRYGLRSSRAVSWIRVHVHAHLVLLQDGVALPAGAEALGDPDRRGVLRIDEADHAASAEHFVRVAKGAPRRLGGVSLAPGRRM